MGSQKLIKALIDVGISPQKLYVDGRYGEDTVVLEESGEFQIFAYYSEYEDSPRLSAGNVTYICPSNFHNELPVVNSLEEVVDDVLRARMHIRTEVNEMQANGGELPDGWCY